MRLPKLDRILSADGELQPLVAKTRDIARLPGSFDGFLPPDLTRQVRVANFREGELVLLAANSSAAAKLKLLAPSLSRFLVEQRWQVNSVSLRVQPNTPKTAAAAAQKTAYFSTHTLDSLQALYDGMADFAGARRPGGVAAPARPYCPCSSASPANRSKTASRAKTAYLKSSQETRSQRRSPVSSQASRVAPSAIATAIARTRTTTIN